MADETTQIARVLDQIGHAALAQLKDLSDEALNRPLTLRETNTLFARRDGPADARPPAPVPRATRSDP